MDQPFQNGVHPSREELETFHTLEDSNPQGFRRIVDHFSTCESCQGTLDELNEEVMLDSRLARPHLNTEPGEVYAFLVPLARELSRLYEQGTAHPTPRNLENDEVFREIEALFQTAAHPEDLGELGEYRILERLGRGGMGAVFLSVHPRLENRVALKVILLSLLHGLPLARERFQREAKTMASIKSPRVVTIHDIQESDGILFLVMEYLEGITLESRLATGERIRLHELLQIGQEIAEGLEAIHDKGLIHRDIKPANVWLLEGSDSVKILDFGLARSYEGDTIEITRGPAVVGTPAYMSLEQCRGSALDHRTDIFSLGRILYRMATGSLPEASPRPIHTERTDIPEDLGEYIMTMLAESRDARPVSAREIVDRLSEYRQSLDDVPVPVLEPPVVPATTGSTVPFSSSEANAETPEIESLAPASTNAPMNRGSRRWGWAGTALVVGIALLITWLMYGGVIVDFAQNKGRAKITVHGTDAEVLVKENGVLIASGKGEFEVRIAPGDHNLKFYVKTKDGLVQEFESKEFSLKRGGREIVAVEYVAPSTTPTGEILGVAWQGRKDVAEGLIATLSPEPPGVIGRMALSPSNDKIVFSVGENIHVHDGRTGKRLFDLPGHTKLVSHLTVSPDGTLIASGASDQTMRLWDVATRKLIQEYPLARYLCEGTRFTPDGRYLIVQSHISPTMYLDLENRDAGLRPLEGLVGPNVGELFALSPDGKLLANVVNNKTEPDAVQLYDIAQRKLIRSLPLGKGHIVNALAFTHDSKTLVTFSAWSRTGDGRMHVWRVADGKQLYASGELIIEGKPHHIVDVRLTPSGDEMFTTSRIPATGDVTYSVHRWDARPLREGKAPLLLEEKPITKTHLHSVLLSRTGNLLLSTSPKQAGGKQTHLQLHRVGSRNGELR